jgi:hypothetical protein
MYSLLDKINDIISHSITGAPVPEAILACHDRMIRVVQDANVLLEIVVEGPAMSLHSNTKYCITALLQRY